MRTSIFFLLCLLLTGVSCQRPNAGTTTATAPASAPLTKHEVKKTADVEWATARGFDLLMDIHVPQTERESYPVIIMYHGGGWLFNQKEVMDDAASYLAENGEYIVCNVNYRLLGDLENTVTMDEIVSDAFGALLWVKRNIEEYGGDPDRIITTGDSAGGHLAAMVATRGHQMVEKGSYDAPNFGFVPSYLPKDGIKKDDRMVQGAMLSYPALNPYLAAKYGFENPGGYFWQRGGAEARGIMGRDYNANDNADRYKQISPAEIVEPAATRDYPPMLMTVGTKDVVTTPAQVKAYLEALKAAGHDNLTYWEHEGRGHAFLEEWDAGTESMSFQDDSVPALKVMLDWLNEIFYV